MPEIEMPGFNAVELQETLKEALRVIACAQRIVESVATGRPVPYDSVEEYHRAIFELQVTFDMDPLPLREFLQTVERAIFIREEPHG